MATKQFVDPGVLWTPSDHFEALAIDGSKFILAQDDGANVLFESYDDDGVLNTSVSYAASTAFRVCGNPISGGLIFFWRSTAGGGDIEAITFTDSNLTIGAGPTTLFSIPVANEVQNVVSVRAGSSSHFYTTYVPSFVTGITPDRPGGITTKNYGRGIFFSSVDNSTLIGTSLTRIKLGYGIESYPFYLSDTGKSYLLVSYQDFETNRLGAQSIRFLIEQTGTDAAVLDVGESIDYIFDERQPLNIGQVGDTFWIPASRNTNIRITESNQRDYLNTYNIHKFTPLLGINDERVHFPRIESNNVAVIGGSLPSIYDGVDQKFIAP